MPTGVTRRFQGLNADESARLARALAPLLGQGDVILLQGGLGAGKTHFARALIQARLAAAGRAEEVPSPTYTLVQVYDDGTCELWHCDLYRLAGTAESVELGLDEALDTAICLVEWPERLPGFWPDRALTIAFEDTEDGAARNLVLRTRAADWAARLDALCEAADG